jgi:hypothetical protein
MTRILVSAACALILSVGGYFMSALMTPAARGDAGTPPTGKIFICHATGSSANPYVQLEADASGNVSGHAGHGDDIIPSFDYTTNAGTATYPGQNLGPLSQFNGVTGAAILANGCVVPTTTTTTNGSGGIVTVTVTTPGQTVTSPGQTVTLPGQTVTSPGQTVTLPGQTVTTPGQTVTLPGQTVTLPGQPGPTVTVVGPGETRTVTQTVTTPGQNHTVTQTVTTPGQVVTAPGQTVTVQGPTHTVTVTKTRTIFKAGAHATRHAKKKAKKKARPHFTG